MAKRKHICGNMDSNMDVKGLLFSSPFSMHGKLKIGILKKL